MRILIVHADYIEIEARQKAIKDAEEIAEHKMRQEELLVVFTAVEKGDEDVAATAERMAKEVDAVAKQVKANNVLIYPLVHLTSNPGAPRVALKVVEKAEELIRKMNLTCNHAPFGWYKSYTIKCKGHPLSELSRELRAEGDTGKIKEETEAVSQSLRKENEIKNKFYVITAEGELVEPEKFNFAKYPNLKKFVDYEIKKARAYAEEPPHIKLMKEHSLVNYEPASDSGHFRWLPKGVLIKKLLERHVTELSVNYGAHQVETPIMYDFDHPALKSYLNRFPARQYTIKSDDRQFFLRFSACFGQFIAAKDMVITYKNLPFKIYELTHYSFRREQSGELAGLKRLRAFSMPDMHTLCEDLGQSKQEFQKQFDLCKKWNDGLGIEFETAFRAQSDFFKENKDWYVAMINKIGKPTLIELFDERYAYFITKFEMDFIDNADKATALSTVQIDVENSERFDLKYVDANGNKKNCLILHASIPGAIERVVYALLEREAMHIKHGKKASFPVWLAPTQFRIIPVSDKHRAHAIKIANKMAKHNVRADCEDRDETLGRKIRDAEREWVPYVAVIGDNEVESGKLSITIRATGEKKSFSTEEIIAIIENENEGKPFEKLSLPQLLSKRVVM